MLTGCGLLRDENAGPERESREVEVDGPRGASSAHRRRPGRKELGKVRVCRLMIACVHVCLFFFVHFFFPPFVVLFERHPLIIRQQKAVQGLEESTSAVVSLLSSLGAARSEVYCIQCACFRACVPTMVLKSLLCPPVFVH